MWVKQVWFASPLNINFENHHSINFTDWLQDTITHAKQDSIEFISTLCYQIWKARNLLIFQQKNIPVMETIQQASTTLQEFKAQLDKGTSKPGRNNHPRSHEISWTPPPTAALKLNVDAHFQSDGRWGIGLVVRTTEGSCLGAATRVVGARSAIQAEARGFEVAIQSIEKFRDQVVIIEMDAQMIVKAVQERSYPRTYWGSIARRGGELLHRRRNAEITWVGRSGNRVAHYFAG
jgi:ribonuclease HI